jgi:adenylate kinase family enzyme
MLPSISFMLGPKASGKSTLGKALASRTNMKFLDFEEFIRANGLVGKKDEFITQELIKAMINEASPRVLIKNFPQNVFQAKYFIKNSTAPSKVFSLKCSKDVSQERMISLGLKHPHYVSSSILSKKI